MARVTGIGGISFKANNPDDLYAWYERHLGMRREPDGYVQFHWQDDHEGKGETVFALFPADTTYFEPSRAPYMLNLRVDDLDALLQQLEADGVEVDPKRDEYSFGKFGWVMDPAGNRIELWEPAE
jgi:catechol 2,3-dioxygenase-like lactoylglutathione lyase family enzyme